MQRWLFIVEGAATAGWALVSMFILLDFPANTKRLTERERKIAIARLREGNVATRTEDNASVGKRQSFMLALRDWRTWGFILGYMVCTPENPIKSLADQVRLLLARRH